MGSDLIHIWDRWWRGFDPGFHRFRENVCGIGIIRRDLYRMNMAKKICEDWASLLFNDKCSLSISDEAGAAFVEKIFAENDFWGNANSLTERAFALGTGAIILRLDNFKLKGGKIAAGEESKLRFEYIDALHIHPISVVNGKIVEARFISEYIRRGEAYVYSEEHILEGGHYVIRNSLYKPEGEFDLESLDFSVGGGLEDAGLKRVMLDGVPEVIRTGSSVPFFAILEPNIQNNYSSELAPGMGVSVFADAIDCLKGVDLAFNNFCRDIKLGGKKVFLSQSLIQRDECGNVITPDDVAQQLFVTLGDGDFSDHPMITEHNPSLRVSDNALAVQWQLNYLAFRCGLGVHHYTFDAEGRVKLTATQYMGERQDMRQNLVKHQRNARSFILAIVRALLWCGEHYFGLLISGDADVKVTFDDSYFSDADSRRAADLSEVEAGVMTVGEFREKWIGGILNE